MTEHERIISDIEKYGIQVKGRNECIKIHRGEKVSIQAAVKAKCYECMGYYSDGARDCEMPECELYAWMPYGAAWKNREKRAMSPAQKAHAATLKKTRVAKSTQEQK